MFKFLVTILMVLAIQPVFDHFKVYYKDKTYHYSYYAKRGIAEYVTRDEPVRILSARYTNDKYPGDLINVVRASLPYDSPIIGYGISVDGEKFALVDENCDGHFEATYKLKTIVVVPDCFHEDFKER